MAKKTTAAPRFYEVVFRGKPKVVKAFLKGLMMGAGRDHTAWYSFDEGIHHEGPAEKFKEMFGVRAVDCHVVLDAEAAGYLKQMQRRIKEETGLEITSNRHIRSASFAFSYHAYAPKYAERIEAALKDLPAGVKLEDWRHDVKHDPSAKGVEAYSAVHDFEASGKGTARGRIDALIGLHHKLDDDPLVTVETIRLNLA